MRKRKIQFSLSAQDVARALQDVKAFKLEIQQKAERLRERVAKEIANEAESGFRKSALDDVLRGGSRNADVTVTVKNGKGVSLVIASGEDAVWIEFGAGVYYNGPVGSSPHPNGTRLGLTIGSYGKGNGAKETWGYYGEDGELRLTKGTRATMPMYNAMTKVCGEISKIAAEVFMW